MYTYIGPARTDSYNPNQYGDGRFDDQVKGHTFDETVFVADVPRHCVCGWHDHVACTVPECWDVSFKEILGIDLTSDVIQGNFGH